MLPNFDRACMQLLTETPDTFYYFKGNKKYEQGPFDNNAVTFGILGGTMFYSVSEGINTKKSQSYTHAEIAAYVNHVFNKRNEDTLNPKNPIKYVGAIDPTRIKEHMKLRYHGGDPREAFSIAGRLWIDFGTKPYDFKLGAGSDPEYFNPIDKTGKNMISFWNEKSQVVRFRPQIENLLKHFGADLRRTYVESIDMDGEANPVLYSKYFGIKKQKPTKTRSQREINDLKAQAHAIPGLGGAWKQALRNL